MGNTALTVTFALLALSCPLAACADDLGDWAGVPWTNYAPKTFYALESEYGAVSQVWASSSD